MAGVQSRLLVSAAIEGLEAVIRDENDDACRESLEQALSQLKGMIAH